MTTADRIMTKACRWPKWYFPYSMRRISKSTPPVARSAHRISYSGWTGLSNPSSPHSAYRSIKWLKPC